MFLSRVTLRLFFNDSLIKVVPRLMVSSVPKVHNHSFSSKYKEVLKTNEKLSQSVAKQSESLKVPKRNELLLEDVKSLLDAKEILLIDVRDKSDVEKYGMIPGAIHIPLNKLKSSLNLTKDDFAAAFHKEKPEPVSSHRVVFYGLKEVKSMSACEIAYTLGFKKARSFPGGFQEWCERGEPVTMYDYSH